MRAFGLRFLLSALLLAATPAPAAIPLFKAPPQASLDADARAQIARIEAYLNGIRTLTAHFTQVGPDGSVTEGELSVLRPGKMRFQYDPPTPVDVISDGTWVTYHDSELHQTNRTPLSATPLSLLVGSHVTLSGDVTVSRFAHEADTIRLTVVETRNPGKGKLTLVFSDKPLALSQWIVTDPQNQETRITLSDLRLGDSVDPKQFEALSTGKP